MANDFKSRFSRRRSTGVEVLERRQLLSVGPLPLPAGSVKLTGNLIGTSGSYQNQGNTIANAVDGNTSTFFDSPTASGGWVGLDLGAEETVAQVQYVPRSNYPSRMVGGIFQGSDTADFSSGVANLYTISATPAVGVFTAATISTSPVFRYVRYLAPANGYGNIAELEFDGVVAAPTAPPDDPGNVVATALSASHVQITWTEDATNPTSSFTIEREGPADSSYVVIGTAPGNATSYDDLNTTASTAYSYEVFASNSAGNSNLSSPAGVTTPAVSQTASKLTGTIIGTTGSYQNLGNTIANVFDGNFSTYFDASAASGNWVGLDLGFPQTITQVQYAPRANWGSRMVGGEFQGSNTADFSSGVTTFSTITATPSVGAFTAVSIGNGSAFRYVRYLAPVNSYGNIAELEFDGYAAVVTAPPAVPSEVSAIALLACHVQITWTEDPSSVVSSFTIEREGPADSSYVVMGTAPGNATSYDDLTTTGTTEYSYEVLATNSAGNSNLSDPVNATTPAPVPPSAKLIGTAIGTSGSFQNLGNTIAKAFDGNFGTYFDAPTGTGNWVGLDLGSPQAITQVQYAPRSNFAARMVGGVFQASNTADFSSGVVTLFTITSAPAANVFTPQQVITNGGFRYVRYLSPSNSYGNVAELEFDGYSAAVIPLSTTFPNSIASWTTGVPSTIVRAEAVGATVNGKVYVFGGFDNEGSDTTTIPEQSLCSVYDPATNTWAQVATFPEPFTHSQGVVAGNDIWFCGGYVGNHPGPGTTHVWIYDTVANTWTRGPDLPQARGAGAAALVGNTIYFTGGMDITRTIDENTTWALDLNNQAAGWVQMANLPNGRNHVAAASLGGYLYVIGGQHGQEDDQAAQNEVDRYDPTTNTWEQMASLPVDAGKSHITEGTLVYDGRIVVIGGETGYNDPQQYIVDYDPVTNTWNELGMLPAARSTVVAGIVNGQLIATTGNSPDATTTTFIGTLG